MKDNDIEKLNLKIKWLNKWNPNTKKTAHCNAGLSGKSFIKFDHHIGQRKSNKWVWYYIFTLDIKKWGIWVISHNTYMLHPIENFNSHLICYHLSFEYEALDIWYLQPGTTYTFPQKQMELWYHRSTLWRDNIYVNWSIVQRTTRQMWMIPYFYPIF